MRLKPKIMSVLTLALDSDSAATIARLIRRSGHPVRQQWVSSHSAFREALQREPVDLAIIHCRNQETDIPVCILRYPDTPFIGVVDQIKPRLVEAFMETGLTDVGGLNQPERLARQLLDRIHSIRQQFEITQLHQELEARNTLFETLLNQTSEAIAYLHQGLFVYANPAFRAHVGFVTDDELYSSSLLSITDTAYRVSLADTLKALETGRDRARTITVPVRTPVISEVPRIDAAPERYQPFTLDLRPSSFAGEQALQLLMHPQ